jgi:hypothetical protein
MLFNKDSTIQKCFGRICIAYKSEDFRFPVSRPDGRAIPSRRSSVHCSIRPDDVPYRPDARQIKHHPSGRRGFLSGPFTVSRSFCSSLHPSSAARPDALQYSIKLPILSKIIYGKIAATVRMMWISVRTRFSLRQESQFKFNRPDASLPSSECVCI